MITRIRLTQQPAPEPDDEPQEAPARRRKPVPQRIVARLNKNLMNYPLARDTRAGVQWQRDGDSLLAHLPGDNRITVILPRICSGHRLPTALDVNVLLAILAEAQRLGGGADEKGRWRFRPVERVEFASTFDLLRKLRMECRSRGSAQISECLDYLRAVSIRFSRRIWYQHDRDKGRKRDRTLPPPIRRIERRGRRLVITLDREWSLLGAVDQGGYYEPVPLPLPAAAAAQNLALMSLAWPASHEIEDGVQIGEQRDIAWVNRHLGLTGSRRNSVLRHAADQATDWWRGNGGDLMIIVAGKALPPGKMTMCVLRKLRLPRQQNRARWKGATKATPRAGKGATNATEKVPRRQPQKVPRRQP